MRCCSEIWKNQSSSSHQKGLCCTCIWSCLPMTIPNALPNEEATWTLGRSLIPSSAGSALHMCVWSSFCPVPHFVRHDRLPISVYQVRWRRQRGQQHHLSAMWCISELDFMIISLLAKSEMNYLQISSKLCSLHKWTLASLMSCDTNLTKPRLLRNHAYQDKTKHSQLPGVNYVTEFHNFQPSKMHRKFYKKMGESWDQ